MKKLKKRAKVSENGIKNSKTGSFQCFRAKVIEPRKWGIDFNTCFLIFNKQVYSLCYYYIVNDDYMEMLICQTKIQIKIE